MSRLRACLPLCPSSDIGLTAGSASYSGRPRKVPALSNAVAIYAEIVRLYISTLPLEEMTSRLVIGSS